MRYFVVVVVVVAAAAVVGGGARSNQTSNSFLMMGICFRSGPVECRRINEDKRSSRQRDLTQHLLLISSRPTQQLERERERERDREREEDIERRNKSFKLILKSR